MPIALAQVRDLLQPNLWAVTGKYPQIPRVWDKIYQSPQVEYGPGALCLHGIHGHRHG